MCILLIQIPSDTKPLIIANNRDEFLRRPTSRGSLVSGFYSPIDKQSGGSWIAYDTVRSRYAVILNFHLWRYKRSVDISGQENTTSSITANNSNIASSSSQYKSRGLLVNDFITSKLSVEDYKNLFLQTNGDFKGFHFLFGDAHTCYLLTKSYENESVIVNKLTSGEIYGVSNGHVCDKNWRKVEIALKNMRTIVSQYTNDSDNDNNTSTHTSINTSKWEQLANTLLNDLLRDSTLLPDATMTRLNLPSTLDAQQLAAIFVLPTVLSPSVFPLPPPLSPPAVPLLPHSSHISANNTSDNNTTTTRVSHREDEEEKDDESQVITTLKRASTYLNTIVNAHTPNSYSSLFNATFATRTSTIIIAYTSSSNNPPQINDIVSDGRNPFLILENDLDPVSGEWSIQCIHNI